MGSSELLLERVLAERLQVAVSTNMLLPDENIRYRPLVGHFLERILDRSAIIYAQLAHRSSLHLPPIQSRDLASTRVYGKSLTDLVQLENLKVGAELGQELLAGLAVRAVALAEDGDAVVVDDVLGLGLCGGHACWTGWSGEGKEGSDEGRYCGGGCMVFAVGVIRG